MPVCEKLSYNFSKASSNLSCQWIWENIVWNLHRNITLLYSHYTDILYLRILRLFLANTSIKGVWKCCILYNIIHSSMSYNTWTIFPFVWKLVEWNRDRSSLSSYKINKIVIYECILDLRVCKWLSWQLNCQTATLSNI